MGWAREEWGVGRRHDGWGIYKGCGAEGKGYTKWEGIKKKWEGIEKGMGGSRVGYMEGVVEVGGSSGRANIVSIDILSFVHGQFSLNPS